MRILLLIVLVTIAVPRNTITLSIIPEFITNRKIKILSDFPAKSDEKFFEYSFPWLVYNFPNLEVEYYFKDGEAGGKRMCVVQNTINIQWQADFLQCQAKGKEDCKEEQYVQQRAYNRCIQKVYLQMRDADNAFRKYKPLYTPFIIDGWSKITTEDPVAILENMCGGFSWVKPEGCKQPSPLPDSEDKSMYPEKKDETDSAAKAEPDNSDVKEKLEPSKVKDKDSDATKDSGGSVATAVVATA